MWSFQRSAEADSACAAEGDRRRATLVAKAVVDEGVKNQKNFGCARGDGYLIDVEELV